MRSSGLALALFILSIACASAQTPRLLGNYGGWSTWAFTENNSKVCYIFSDAVEKEPEHLDHGRVSFFIRHIKSGQAQTEASLQVGYRYAPGAIRVAVNGKAFTMIPRGNSAWLRRTVREHEFTRALLSGRRMTVEAVSQRGNKTRYEFSLKGFTAAMRKMNRDCR